MSIWDVQITGNEAQEGDYPIAKPGIYNFEVANAKLVEYKPKPGSKIPNCAELDLQLELKGASDDGKNVTVFDRIYFAPNTIWRATAFTKCTGVFTEGMTPKDIALSSCGETGKVEVEIHEYNGKKSNRVKKYILPSAPEAEAFNPVDSSELPF